MSFEQAMKFISIAMTFGFIIVGISWSICSKKIKDEMMEMDRQLKYLDQFRG